MEKMLLYSIPNNYVWGFLIGSGVVIIYLAAKALMRYLDNRRNNKG
jgi:hypothetical protein